MKIATWNVNSVRARLPHVTKWLNESDVDVLLLQETKSVDKNFPLADIEATGYKHCAIYGQPSYNGVAIVSRLPLSDVVCGLPARPDLEQARVIAATVQGLRVISAYVPNGQSVGTEKYAYKMDWLAAFRDELAAHAGGATVVGGDYNIAPADDDVYDINDWGYSILTSPQERDAFQALLDAGYADAFRLFEQRDDGFSWWDYRTLAFQRNRGIRIDLFLLSAQAAARCIACTTDKAPRAWERPSDHTPVIIHCDD